MAVSVLAALTIFAVVGVLTIRQQLQIETRPLCDRCATYTHLVREEWASIGFGWLEAHRTYKCPSCATVLQRDAVSGPGDLLS
jgi:hypothetical protein